MDKSRLEQLRKVFKKILESYVTIGSWNMKEVIAKLIYEVKIRTNNK